MSLVMKPVISSLGRAITLAMALPGALPVAFPVALAIAMPARAETTPAPMVRPDGVLPYPAPPLLFNPATAANASLLAYGLPAHPPRLANGASSNPALDHAIAAMRTYIPARLRVVMRRHGPARGLVSHAAAQYSTNWAGQVLENTQGSWGSGSYAEIMAQWVISGVIQGHASCPGTDYSSTWVGIDGYDGSPDVLQSGTEADAVCQGGTQSQNIYAWVEWYPGNTNELYNFPVTVGGAVFVVLQANGPGAGSVTLVNLQTGAYTSLGIAPPAGTVLRGNTAEWVVERPALDNGAVLANLADFAEIPMESEIAYLQNQLGSPNYSVPGAPTPGQTSIDLTMITPAGTALATTVPQGVSAQLMQVTPATQ